MKRFTGAATVEGGYYLNLEGWKLEVVEGETGTLPGTAADRYLRVPALALLVLAPLMGLAFVVLLPFIGVAVVLEQLWVRGREAVVARRAAADTKRAGVERR